MNELHLFAGAGGEVSSVESYQDIPAYVLSRSKSIQEKSCCKDSEMDCSQDSRSGMTLRHLTEDLGTEELISLPGGSHVRTFPQQEKELASRASGQDSGARWPGWFARYDQDLSLWKTPQCSLLEDYIEFSETWPKWGTMRDGVCWELMTPERHTEERGSGYWPTPAARDYKGANSLEHCEVNGNGRKHMDQLPNAVAHGGKPTRRTFPTPGCTGMSNGTGNCEKANQLHRDGVITDEERRSMRAGNGGQLNPQWVEWLMGWPIGWTDLKQSETDRFQQWQRSHGVS